MCCERKPAGAFPWSLIKKEALGYLQAAGKETERMEVRQNMPDFQPQWVAPLSFTLVLLHNSLTSSVKGHLPFLLTFPNFLQWAHSQHNLFLELGTARRLADCSEGQRIFFFAVYNPQSTYMGLLATF